MEDITKSIKAYLYERAESPLFPTFIGTWCVWNWKILYVTFILSEKTIVNKLTYIEDCFSNIWINLWLPLISTALLILVVPFASNGSFWVSERFKQWRKNKKRDFEKKTLLTEEQSVKILLDMEKQKVDYATSFTTYETELKREKATSNKLLEDLKKIYDQEKSDLLTTHDSEKSELHALLKTKADELIESKNAITELTNAIIESKKIKKGLIILRAEYGNEIDSINVTEKVQNLVKDDKLHIKVNERTLGNPEWATDKALTVIYMYDTKIHFTIAKKDQVVTIPNAQTIADMMFTGRL